MVAESTTGYPHDLTLEQLVDQITTVNPTASPEFLARFTAANLANYLRHLLCAQEPRGRTARWIRPQETPAIMGWEPAV